MAMKGIQFVTDESGKKTAVLISLEEWGEVWDDLYDVLVSRSRQNEPTVPWEDLRAEMDHEQQSHARAA
jgi:hypothetical protein